MVWRMSEAVRAMTAEAFLDWCLGQEGRWELVDGVPVAMAGARRGHDLVVVNALTSLRPALRGGPCQPFTGDFAVRIPNGNIRRPDVGVDCGPVDLNSLTATDPRLVIEVLSPSTRTFDAIGKLREYQRVPGLRHIILVDPDEPRVWHWRRPENGPWTDLLLEGLDAVIDLPDLGATLALRDLYEGLTFRPRLRPVPEPPA